MIRHRGKAGVEPAPSRYYRDALTEVTLLYGIIQKFERATIQQEPHPP